MANTYTLISSNVLSSSAASVTFSSIPATYTDLVLRVSARSANSGVENDITINLNNSTVANYSYTLIQGTGSETSSNSASNDSSFYYYYVDGNTATANTFGSFEVYFANYASSANKVNSGFFVQENNTTGAYINAFAGLWSNVSAINEIKITSQSAANFVSGSSFYLYGIKNS